MAAAPGDGWQAGVFPLGLPLLAGPAGLAAAISVSTDHGFGLAAGAMLLPVLLGGMAVAVGGARWPAAADGLARLLGALLIVLAAGLAIDGVRAI